MDEVALRAVPFFRNLPSSTLGALVERLRPERWQAGSVLFRRGEAGDTMYIVESGQLEALTDVNQEPLASLGPGSFLGEIALLLDQPRSATVRVTADTQLWALSRADLEGLLAEHPVIGTELSRELSRRLVATSRRVTPAPPIQCVAILGEGAVPLARMLHDAELSLVHIVVLPGAAALPVVPEGVTQVSAEGAGPDEVRALARGHAGGSRRLLLLLPQRPSPVSAAALAVSEYVVVFGACPDWVSRGRAQHRVLHCDGSAASLERTSRWIRGRAIGLALSSGGNKTVAHIGVLRVLREMGVTIDAVAGTSGGALAAAAVACGMAEAEMMERLHALARGLRFHRLDFNLVPRTAISKGVRIHRLLDAFVDGRTFAQTQIPMWLVATDLATGEEVVLDSGPLAHAMRASMSMPVFFNPWRHDGRMLIDGAVVNPLPASVLREAGIRFVVGSNVAGQDFVVDASTGSRLPNLLQIVSRIIGAMERELLKAQVPLVDVLVRPRVLTTNSLDFSRVTEFIAEGERAARSELAGVLPAAAAVAPTV